MQIHAMSSAYPLIVACHPDAAPGYGAQFRITSLARPVPDSDQVLVRIMASGVNPLDIKIHAGCGLERFRMVGSVTIVA